MNLTTLKILMILITLTGAFLVWQSGTFRNYGDQLGYEPIQPINFSHKLHAGDNQISCLFCHSSADKSRVAGVPPASTCMNCHTKVLPDSPEIQKITAAIAEKKPIEWVKVNDLPDLVAFNHSRHVTSGVSCQTCHGPVETMERLSQQNSFTMGDCVSCHRTHRDVTLDEAGKPQIAREKTAQKLMASTDCSVCHH
ncbi:MAG TPA: cytochrome c3 family protein [Pyrinomonadaceae bacterium]|nr:cytochrome c3 family protein [Pyrinomonadaceae bacterium]